MFETRKQIKESLEQQMAEREGERLARLEEKTSNIEKTMSSIENKLDRFIESADEKYAPKLTEKLVNRFIETADEKYANKLTERAVIGMAALVLGSVLYLILASVGISN